MHATLHFDGASKGNPGRAGSGSVLRVTGSPVVHRVLTPFGRPATCNEAEYVGLLVGLKLAQRLGATHLSVRGDSKLVIEQARGAWKCREPRLQALLRKAQGYLRQFHAVDLAWIPRDENAEADAASNQAVAAGRQLDPLRPEPAAPSVTVTTPKPPMPVGPTSSTVCPKCGALCSITRQTTRDDRVQFRADCPTHGYVKFVSPSLVGPTLTPAQTALVDRWMRDLEAGLREQEAYDAMDDVGCR